MRFAALALLTLAACSTPTPLDIEGAACAGEPGRDYYHAATRSVSPEWPTRADVETTYQDALLRVGPCPFYLFQDEWCEPPTECGRDEVYWIALWEGVETCRDLYWSRGAYCRGVTE